MLDWESGGVVSSERNAIEDLRQLSSALQLPYESQDWGIVNADGERLEEFIRYYEWHSELSRTQKYELGELILASANERLIAGLEILPPDFEDFLKKRGAEFEGQLKYWGGLGDEKEFPISNWLNGCRVLQG